MRIGAVGETSAQVPWLGERGGAAFERSSPPGASTPCGDSKIAFETPVRVRAAGQCAGDARPGARSVARCRGCRRQSQQRAEGRASFVSKISRLLLTYVCLSRCTVVSVLCARGQRAVHERSCLHVAARHGWVRPFASPSKTKMKRTLSNPNPSRHASVMRQSAQVVDKSGRSRQSSKPRHSPHTSHIPPSARPGRQ